MDRKEEIDSGLKQFNLVKEFNKETQEWEALAIVQTSDDKFHHRRVTLGFSDFTPKTNK